MAINNAINNTIGGSNPGISSTLTIINTSNTASSQALDLISVAGSSAGDPFTTYTVNGVTNWSIGIDNSVSDTFTLAASNTLGTTNVMTAATNGLVQVVLGDFTVGRSNSGGSVKGSVVNASNTASSDAVQIIQQGGPLGGDAYIQWQISGSNSFTQGIDISQSAFVLSSSASLGTNNIMSTNPNGQINYPLQPSFQVYLNTTVPNVTGDNTTYDLVYDTVSFDQASNITLNSSGKTIFTAPKTGKYLFNGCINFTWGVPGTLYASMIYEMVATSGTYRLSELAFPDFNTVGAGFYGNPFSTIIPMSAGDTAFLTATINFASGKTASFRGLSLGSIVNYWCGYLVC